jgi:hypothetical protein
MLVDYGGQSCYEGWNEYQRAQQPQPLAACPDWHDETPGALADHCPLVQAPPVPAPAPDWHDEAPRLSPATASPLPTAVENTQAQRNEETAARRDEFPRNLSFP